MAMLEIRDVSMHYGHEAPVLSHVDFDVESGELAFLLGSSGCGKSTLLRIVAGFLKPDSGTIVLNGKDITSIPPEKRNTPMVFQSYALWPHLNVADNVAFGLRARHLPTKEIASVVDEMLSVTGMTGFAARKVNELSGGQQQRVALARALALRGEILLLDEPLSNLDAKLRDRMRLEIRRICRERHLTALYVTHDRREALSVGDRIAVMRDGQILESGTPHELYYRPAHAYTASFLGDAEFLSGRCSSADSSAAVFDTVLGVMSVSITSSRIVPHPGTEYTLMFRPEAVRIGVPPDTCNSFQSILQDRVFLGETTSCTLVCGDLTLHANEILAGPREIGTPLVCAVPPEYITILPAANS